jgi:TrmH family RNA methyltransferase
LAKIFSKTSCQIYGAFLEGESIYKTQFASKGIVLLGNESNGISENMSKFVTQKISIPRFGAAESLNVGVATAIICDNWRRNQM